MKLVLTFVALFTVAGIYAQTAQPSGSKTPGQAKSGTEQVSDATLKSLEATYKVSKTAFEKKPKDAKSKKTFVNAAFAVGLGRMYSVSLPPRAKYSTALDAFREVMKLEPNHKLAKQNYDMIAKIYKQMGRPVPGEK